MIIDQILLAGPDAYLRNGSEIDLASAAPATGTLKVSERGRVLRVEGIDVLIEAEDLLSHFPRRSDACLTFPSGNPCCEASPCSSPSRARSRFTP